MNKAIAVSVVLVSLYSYRANICAELAVFIVSLAVIHSCSPSVNLNLMFHRCHLVGSNTRPFLGKI